MDDIRPQPNQTNNQFNPAEAPPSPPPEQTEAPQQPSADSLQGSQFAYNAPKPKKRRKLKAFLLLLLLAVIGAGAWFAFGRGEEKQNAPVVENKDVNELRIGIVGSDYGVLYPETPAPSSYNTLVNAQIFEGLVRYEGKSKIVPLLATDWSNPDAKTWVFNLKQGVKFHNGNTMKAADVKYSIDKIKKSGTDYNDIFAGTIESVKALDDSRVEIKTTQPDPALLNRLAFLYVIDSNAPKGSEPSLAGTGPYVIQEGSKPTTRSVQMTAYNDYHGGVPKTKAVTLGSEKDVDALLKTYAEGKYNLIGEVPLARADKLSDEKQFITSEPEVAFLGMNSLKKGPLQNKKVREAIRYAVDPELLGKAEGDEVTPISQLIPDSIPGYNPAIEPYQRDVAKAKQLLSEAGYKDGITLKFSHSSSAALADELLKQLKEAGITMKVDFKEDFGEFIDLFSSGKAEMYYIIYTSDILDGLDIYETTLTTSGNYENESLNKLLEQAATTVDPAARLKLLQDAAVIIDQDVAVVPLSTRDNVWLMDRDYNLVQDMPSSFLSVYFHKVQLK